MFSSSIPARCDASSQANIILLAYRRMNNRPTDTHSKALQINLDAGKYGTFAEIGAGQEVARWFFRAGGAAGTVAKSMSAYDMVVSDAIYGPTDRYVSRRRLQAMLDHEYQLLIERLHSIRGASTKFFAFANTVTARSYLQREESHGWMGIRFQAEPNTDPCDIWIHVRMLDRENVQQQETLGIMGVNLIYGAIYLHSDPPALISSLIDNLTAERVEVDMICFAGRVFSSLDNRLMSLQLVELGLTDSAVFTADGQVAQAAEVLYKKPILVERGTFRPVTNVTIDMLRCAETKFLQEPNVHGEEVLVLTEMTMKNLRQKGAINHQDYLDRADLLSALGTTVLISRHGAYHRLAAYLFRYTKKMIGIVMGVPSLRALFDEQYYSDLEGGILESFGRLFKNAAKLYVHPFQDPVTKEVTTADNLKVAPHLQHLYSYLLENRFIESLTGCNISLLPIFSKDVVAKIRSGDSTWAQMVPPPVAKIIRERGLFGWRE
jgi:hypothetical protein